MTSNPIPARYIRFRGRVYGPFSSEELMRMVKRGQVSRLHELSEDNMSWVRADSDDILFPRQSVPAPTVPSAQTPMESVPEHSGLLKTLDPIASGSPANAIPSVVGSNPAVTPLPPRPAAAMPAEEWYYSIGGARYGPISTERLNHMRQQVQIEADTLVWRPGMERWVPFEQLGADQNALFGNTASNSIVAAGHSGNVGPIRQRVRTEGTIIGLIIGAVILICLHIPLVAQSQTFWWWDALPSVGLGMILIYLLLSGLGLCIVSPITQGLPRALVFLGIGGVGVLSFAVALASQGNAGEMLLSLLLLACASALAATSAYRRHTGPAAGARAAHGILGGLVDGIALILCLIFIMRLTDSGKNIGPLPSVSILGLFFVGSSFLCLIGAGVCALASLAPKSSPQLNLATEWLIAAGLGLCWVGPVLVVAGTLKWLGQSMGVLAEAPPTAAGQLVVLALRAAALLLLQFAVFSRGLFELLMSAGVGRQKQI